MVVYWTLTFLFFDRIPSCCRAVLLLHADPGTGVLHCHSHVPGYQRWDGCGGCGQSAHHDLFCPDACKYIRGCVLLLEGRKELRPAERIGLS